MTVALAWLVLLAQPVPTPDLRARFRARVSEEARKAVSIRTEYCETRGAQERLAQQRNNEAAGANALGDGAGTSTGAERLAAAVNTGIDGVEAGVVLAPLALVPSFSPKTPHGPSLLVAALKDGKVRAGAGYAVTVRQSVDADDAWRATACGDPTEREATITKAIEEAMGAEAEDAYVSVCSAVTPHLDAHVTSACEGSSQACTTANARRTALAASCSDTIDVQTLAATAEKLLEDEHAQPELQRALRRVKGSLETLRTAGDALVATKVGGDTKGFVQRYRSRQWRAVSVRLGVDGSVDFARRQFGKRRLEAGDPGAPGEPEDLDGGELLAWRVGPAVLIKRGRAQSTLGVNGGQAIPVGAKAMFTTLEPSASFSWLVAFLDDERVDRGPRYRARTPKFDDDGNLPPHVVLGARASVKVPITQPTFQEDTLDAATFLVHADFIVTKTLKFRLGVPLTAKLVEQEANTDAEPDIPKRTVLRWTIPVFGTTVLAF